MFICLAALAFVACAKDSKSATTENTKETPTVTPPTPTDKPADKPADRPVETPPPEPPQPPPGKVAAYGEVFDQTCATDDDCMLETTSKCSHCGCTNFPISVSERLRFRDARVAFECPPPDPAELEISCGGCPGFTPACSDGICRADIR
jgi:hypothetical protein